RGRHDHRRRRRAALCNDGSDRLRHAVRSYFPSSSSANRADSYTLRSASMIARDDTLTDRAASSVKMNRLGSDSMLPSKMRPTSSPSRLIPGLPELPPMMSLVDTK